MLLTYQATHCRKLQGFLPQGSDSDMPVMAKAADILEELGISFEMNIISAHREPDVFFEYAKTAEEKGFKVIIAGAGMAAHKCSYLSNALFNSCVPSSTNRPFSIIGKAFPS